jgi:SSS family solute:Na+ symporter
VPYVAIQIRGLAIFLEAAFPGAVSAWIWSTAIVAVMLTYSEIGGLRAIMYSGLTLLTSSGSSRSAFSTPWAAWKRSSKK